MDFQQPTTPIEALLREFMAEQKRQHEENREQLALLLTVLQKMEQKLQPPARLYPYPGPFIAEAISKIPVPKGSEYDLQGVGPEAAPEDDRMSPTEVAERINKAWRAE